MGGLGAHRILISLLGGLRPMFSRLFPPTGRSTQRTVSPGQLGQAPAGEQGRWGPVSGWQPGSPRATRQASGEEPGGMQAESRELGDVVRVWPVLGVLCSLGGGRCVEVRAFVPFVSSGLS